MAAASQRGSPGGAHRTGSERRGRQAKPPELSGEREGTRALPADRGAHRSARPAPQLPGMSNMRILALALATLLLSGSCSWTASAAEDGTPPKPASSKAALIENFDPRKGAEPLPAAPDSLAQYAPEPGANLDPGTRERQQ